MELRVLEYFLAVAREQSISAAAETLHLTQPTLSRQLKDLEDEFGKQLFHRGSRKIVLTEDGIYFKKKAEEIITLARRTEAEMKSSDNDIGGDVYIGAGETDAIRHIAQVARTLQGKCPGIHFHIISGDSTDLLERLDKGLFDICLLLGPIDQRRYEYIALPYVDTWGVLMRRDSPIADLDVITPYDIYDKPLILSRQSMVNSAFARWFERPITELNVVATYNLAYNASIMAREHMGYVITLDKLINTESSVLCFKPLMPSLTLNMSLVWKKNQPLSKAADKFLKAIREHIS